MKENSTLGIGLIGGMASGKNFIASIAIDALKLLDAQMPYEEKCRFTVHITMGIKKPPAEIRKDLQF